MKEEKNKASTLDNTIKELRKMLQVGKNSRPGDVTERLRP